MPPGSPFLRSWWFRTDFQLPADYRGKTLWLNFDGINYRANVWMNGREIASADKLVGTWRLFNLDVSSVAQVTTWESTPRFFGRKNAPGSRGSSALRPLCDPLRHRPFFPGHW